MNVYLITETSNNALTNVIHIILAKKGHDLSSLWNETNRNQDMAILRNEISPFSRLR